MCLPIIKTDIHSSGRRVFASSFPRCVTIHPWSSFLLSGYLLDQTLVRSNAMTRTNRDHSSPDPTWDEYSEGSIDSTDPYLYSLTDLIPHSPRTPTMSHHHHPLPTQPYPPPYPPTSHASHPSYNGAPGNGSHSHAHHHHHPSRQAQHVSNGPPLPPPPSGLAGPAILTSASAEPSAHMGNGHAAANGAHGTYPGHGGHHHNGSNNSAASASAMSPVARAAREKMDSVLSQLASANENTWMLIGQSTRGINEPLFLTRS